MGRVYPQRARRDESRGRRRLKGHSFHRKGGKLRDIDVRGGGRVEMRQLGEKGRAFGSEKRRDEKVKNG